MARVLLLALLLAGCGGAVESAELECVTIAAATTPGEPCEQHATERCELGGGWVQYRVSAARRLGAPLEHFLCAELEPGAVEDIASCASATRERDAMCASLER